MGLEYAVGYGVLSAAVLTITYVALTILKRHHRNTMLEVKTVRYLKLRMGR